MEPQHAHLQAMSDHDLLIEIATTQQMVCKELEGIHEQQKTTNGRVRSLELWRYLLTGGLAVVVFILVQYVIPRLP